MQTVKSFFARHRQLFLTLLVAAAAVLTAAWAGFDLSQRVDGQPVYEMLLKRSLRLRDRARARIEAGRKRPVRREPRV